MTIDSVTKPVRSGSKFKKGRKPHNAPSRDYVSFADMVRQIANESRKAQVGGREVTLSRAEGVYRLMVERALSGNKRELVSLLKMMMKRPDVSATFQEFHVTIIGGSLAEV